MPRLISLSSAATTAPPGFALPASAGLGALDGLGRGLRDGLAGVRSGPVPPVSSCFARSDENPPLPALPWPAVLPRSEGFGVASHAQSAPATTTRTKLQR